MYDEIKIKTKLKWWPWVLIKLSFKQLSESSLSCLSTFDNMVISLSQKWSENQVKVHCELMTHQFL